MIATEYPAVIEVANGPVCLQPGGAVEIAYDAQPSRVDITLRCGRCSALAHAMSEPRFTYCDDDHYGYSELGFDGLVQCDCPECAAPMSATLRLTLTRYANGTASLAWEPVAGTDSER